MGILLFSNHFFDIHSLGTKSDNHKVLEEQVIEIEQPCTSSILADWRIMHSPEEDGPQGLPRPR